MQKYIILCLMVLLAGTGSFAEEQKTDSIVIDRPNAIYWQDNSFSQNSSEDWDDAVLYCDQLVLNGIAHWRLPTFRELLSIVDYTRSHPAINKIFYYVDEGTYWTSTDFSATEARAWTIDFRTGKTYYSYKTTNHAVRCVKDIETEPEKEKK